MAAIDVLQKARSNGRTLLTEVESKELVKESGIPVVETRLACSRTGAVSIARKIGLPVVLKIVSPDVIHKSDVGGVKIGLATLGQVRAAYDSIISSIVKFKEPSELTDSRLGRIVFPLDSVKASRAAVYSPCVLSK